MKVKGLLSHIQGISLEIIIGKWIYNHEFKLLATYKDKYEFNNDYKTSNKYKNLWVDDWIVVFNEKQNKAYIKIIVKDNDINK